MKFNIFDPNTWTIEQEDLETKLRNKAVGAIGQKMSDVYDFEQKILKHSNEQVEFNIAEELKVSNSTAFKLMNISYVYPNDDIKSIKETIDQIRNIWGDKNGRNYRWREVISLIIKLKPYLEDHKSFYFKENSIERNLDKLTSIKVQGNDAWYVYLKTNLDLIGQRKTTEYYNDLYKALKNKYEPESDYLERNDYD